jgi:hypothetical protein
MYLIIMGLNMPRLCYFDMAGVTFFNVWIFRRLKEIWDHW